MPAPVPPQSCRPRLRLRRTSGLRQRRRKARGETGQAQVNCGLALDSMNVQKAPPKISHSCKQLSIDLCQKLRMPARAPNLFRNPAYRGHGLPPRMCMASGYRDRGGRGRAGGPIAGGCGGPGGGGPWASQRRCRVAGSRETRGRQVPGQTRVIALPQTVARFSSLIYSLSFPRGRRGGRLYDCMIAGAYGWADDCGGMGEGRAESDGGGTGQ